MNPEAASEGALEAAASPDPPTEILTLLPDMRALIIRSLTSEATRTLASTSSTALRDVLEARYALKAFKLHRTLARSMAQLTFTAAGNPRSTAAVRCSVGGVTFDAFLPLHTVPQACAEQQHADACTPTDPTLFWFCPAAIASATRVEAECDDATAEQPTFALPAGMGALAAVRVQSCTLLPNRLPPSSCGCVQVLTIIDSTVCIPPDMGKLTALCVRYMQVGPWAGEWLPHSSKKHLRALDLGGTGIRNLPEELGSLEALCVNGCQELVVDWLPASSRQRVRLLLAAGSNITCVPAMPALQALSVGCCRGLTADWLSADSKDTLHTLFLDNTAIVSVPSMMGALEDVWVERCSRLTAGWLPASSSKRVAAVQAANSSIGCVPAGLHALSCLDVRGCSSLAPNWLPLSSAASMCQLRADESSMQTLQLPEGPSALRAVCDTSPVDPGPQQSQEAVRCEYSF